MPNPSVEPSPTADHPYRTLSVLMPVYNEVRTLERIVDAVLSAPIDLAIELVVVDDGSTDGSRELLAELAGRDSRIRPILHDRNRGKAEAVRTAIREMTGDLAIVQDADLEYSPKDYPVMLQPVLDGVAALWALIKYRFFARRFTTHDGFYILQSVRSAKRFNTWMIDQFHGFLGRRVLEGGCGIGNLTELLLDRERLVCLDNDPFYVEVIRRRYGHLANVDVHDMSLASLTTSQLEHEQLDTVVCINVLEHIEEEQDVLRGFRDVLEPGGHAIVLVPAHPWLYTGVDKALGHCRRYTAATLRARMEEAGFDVVRCAGFNRFGTVGWFVSGKIFGTTTITPGQMKLFEWLMPLARLLEWLPILPHLSLVAVGRKPGRARAVVDSPAAVRKAA